jgi:hypothetical protein
MSLNFDEYETDVPEKTIVVAPSKIAGAVQAAPNADKEIIAGSGINPQSSSGLGIDPRTINAVWNEVKPYVDPRHYNDNTSTDYQNIDFPTSIAHGVADVMGVYGVAKGLKYGAGQLFPEPGVAVQRDQLKFQRQEAKRLQRGELNPLEKSRLALEQAKTQQMLASLNPAPVTPPAPMAQMPQAAPPVAPPAQPATPMQTNVATPPTVQQRTLTGDVTDAEKLAAENIKMQPTELPGHTFNKYGVAPTNVKDLMIFANQATPEMKANFAPYLFELMNKGVIPKPALDAGVTPSTSQPEAQTLVTTSEAAKDPIEKVQQQIEAKTQATAPVQPPVQKIEPAGTPVADLEVKQITPTAETEVAGAVKPKASKTKNPVESMKNYLTGSQGFNEEQYKVLMNDILGKNLEMHSTGGGFGEKSHPEEWKKYMAWRKENIEGPKSNLSFDIKKKFRDVEKIEDPKVRATARNALLVALASLPAFLNAKTPKEMREARRGLGEAILPTGMTTTEAGAPTLPANAFSESKKLGSPFRQQLMGVAPPAR